jgi:hypothetical protein
MSYGAHGSSLRDLPRLRRSRRRRASSWDTTGANRDFLVIEPGRTVSLADVQGSGSINHIWCVALTTEEVSGDASEREYAERYRRLLLRITWDDQEHPSVLVPLGDFFGVGHGRILNFSSAPLQMSPAGGLAFNSWFHMPFASRARVELVSEMSELPISFWYYVDYELFDELGEDLGYFHAQWNRQNLTDGIEQGPETDGEFILEGINDTGEENYVILDAEGRGHYVGCVLNLRNVHEVSGSGTTTWYGEGDDMIFIDGEPFPPSLHGTGTEDYFNTALCPREEYHAPYHGITIPGDEKWEGEVSLYRFHIEDPVTFEKSIRVTIEHGHANKLSNDYSSVAYWYQTLPHRPFAILPVEQRLPRAEG